MSTVTYDQDPDVIRWGLNLLDFGDSYSNNVYCTTLSPPNCSYYDGEYRSECHYHSSPSNVESDEMLAHALQEELSQLAVAEAAGTPDAGDEHLQASILAQDWFAQSPNNYGSGHEGVAGESDDMESSSSCSGTGERPYDGEDWTTNLDSDEFSALDGEVGKRLNQMVPIPHVPRINGDIPSVDEAISDHQRLLDRLQVYNLVELKIEGDGNCQFRALSDQFYRSPEHHEFVRQQVVDQLKSYPEIYEGYVPMAYGDYLKKISSTGEWGDHVTLQAAADSYGIKIFVVTSFKDTCYIEILPNVQKSKRIIFLSFWAEVHYNSIYPEGEMPVFEETKKKKRWWNFRNKH